jgi:hypothetical protein
MPMMLPPDEYRIPPERIADRIWANSAAGDGVRHGHPSSGTRYRPLLQ